MRIVSAAFCLTALAMTAGCHSLGFKESAAAIPQAELSKVEALRLGPPPTDFKPELGLEGQRSNRQIAVSIQTYKVIPKGFMGHAVSWDKLPKGAKLGPVISPEAGMKLTAFKADRTFAVMSLPAYLQTQGETTLSSSGTTYSLDGMVTPFSTSTAQGYLSQLQCGHAEMISLVPGSAKRSMEYVLTPEIVSDKVVFVSLEARAVTSASEASTCNEKNEPENLVEAREGSLYGVSANLADNDALVISGIEDSETEKDGGIKVVVISAQEMLPVDKPKQ